MKAALLFSLPSPLIPQFPGSCLQTGCSEGTPHIPLLQHWFFLLPFPSGLTHSQVGVDARRLVLRGLWREARMWHLSWWLRQQRLQRGEMALCHQLCCWQPAPSSGDQTYGLPAMCRCLKRSKGQPGTSF